MTTHQPVGMSPRSPQNRLLSQHMSKRGELSSSGALTWPQAGHEPIFNRDKLRTEPRSI